MYWRTVTRQSLKVALMSGLLLAGAFAGAPVSAREPPLTWTAKDSQLKWGPCPPFLPKGCGISVLHGDPAKNNADIFFKVPANSVIPRHWHTSAERMVLISGELHVTYDGQDRGAQAWHLCVWSCQAATQGGVQEGWPLHPVHRIRVTSGRIAE